MESKFTGGLLGLIGISILQGIIMCCTLFIGTPWALCLKQSWLAKHTIIDGKKLTFDGKGGQLFGNFIKWMLLTIITFGIYCKGFYDPESKFLRKQAARGYKYQPDTVYQKNLYLKKLSARMYFIFSIITLRIFLTKL